MTTRQGLLRGEGEVFLERNILVVLDWSLVAILLWLEAFALLEWLLDRKGKEHIVILGSLLPD